MNFLASFCRFLLIPLAFSACTQINTDSSWAQSDDDWIYNPQTPELFQVWNRIADVSPRLRAVETIELSGDGRLAVSGGKFGYAVMLWRTADGHLMWQAEHESEVECVCFSPDGSRVASGGEDFYVRIWDVESGKQLHAWEHPSGLDGITWSNDGKTIASGSEQGDLFLWDAETYGQKGKLNVGSTINSLQFTRDDRRIVVGGNIQTKNPQTGKIDYGGFAMLVDVQTLKPLTRYEGHEASVKSIRISNNEAWVATGGFDGTARLFSLESGKALHVFRQPLRVEAVAFTPDSRYLLVGGHLRSIRFYRTGDFQLAHEVPAPRTEYLDVSDDGRLLATAHEDSGLISLYLFGSDTQHKQGLYQRMANEQLENRDLKD